ncbi:MAG: molybdopterin cofactor-binding domain-containing protein [Clostridia bacterium]
MTKIVGTSLPIKDAREKVTGELRYVADMKLQHMLYAKILFSDRAHAKITSIDTSAAEALAGVHGVLCYKNTNQIKYNSALRFYEHKIPETETVFTDTVRFVGDRVAAVAAESEAIAEAAIKLIKVSYEDLPAVFDVEAAIAEGAPILHGESNIVSTITAAAGDLETGFAMSDHVFEDRYEVPAIHHGAIETHAAIADYSRSGKLTVWSPNQNTFAFRILLSRILELPFHKVRTIRPAMGGSFGGKLELTIEPVVALLAKLTARPVKLVLTRRETMASTRTRHGAVVYLKTGVKNDGEILAQDMTVLLNTGAYAASALNVMGAASHKVFKVYKTPNMRLIGKPIYTNLPIAGAMRGYGSPQVFAAQQAQMFRIAHELRLDPVELQLKNVVDIDGIDQRFGKPLGNARLKECVKRAAIEFDWAGKNLLAKEENGWKRGLGMAIGAHGNGVFGAHRDTTSLILKLNEDGTATLLTGAHDMGNGSTTMQTMMVAEVLGIQACDVETLEADTDACAWNLGDYASRGVFVEGAAAKQIAEKLAEEVKAEAAEMLGCTEVELVAGMVINSANKEESVTLSDIAVHYQQTKQKEFTITDTYASQAGMTSYGAHFAEVLVNPTSGEVKVIELVAIHDVGTVVNPQSLAGQLEGGLHMGLGYGLSEKMEFDDKGKLINNTLRRYKMFKTTDMPKIKIGFIEEPELHGPYGAKSIGECATVPTGPAVFNAVCDAMGIAYHSFPAKIK